MTKRTKIRQSQSDRIFVAVVIILLILTTLIVLYPLLYVVSASFSSSVNVVSGKVWLFPVGFSTFAYQQVFSDSKVVAGFLNTLYYVAAGTVLSLAITIFSAYPLSQKHLVGYRTITKLFLIPTLFSGGLIPFYIVVRNLGMLNTGAAVVVPIALNFFHIILMRTYIQQSIPEELLEAAEIDGCDHVGKLFRIVLPLSGSILAVITLYNVVGQWNSYFYAMIFLNDSSKYPLQIVLRDILINNSTSAMTQDIQELMVKQGLQDVLKYALIVVSSFPLLVVYPFVQKYFVKGVMLGSLKG